MKRITVTLTLCLVLLGAVLPQPVQALVSGRTTAPAKSPAVDDRGQVNTLFAAAKAGELTALEGEPYLGGKLLIAVYDDPESTQPALSPEAMAAGEDFYGLPAERLAGSLSVADTLVVVYPAHYKRNLAQTDVRTQVQVIDPHLKAAWPAVTAAERPGLNFGKTVGRDSIGNITVIDYGKYPGYSPEEAAAWIAGRLTAEEAGDAEKYAEAEALYKEEKYYSAKQAFLKSGYRDYAARAEACRQEWPGTAELWHSPQHRSLALELTIHVNQPEETGWFARIIQAGGVTVSNLFISGTGEVTVSLPEGSYSILCGTGSVWYGTREAFGKNAYYERMTFDEAGQDTVFLEKGHAYTLSINIEAGEAEGTDVDSEEEDWEDFVE
ncbi:MAG: hypothetical protein IJ573_07065 [Clostridia bacterium]|nr:hypothetical protein [Clostridia bacterium]